MTHDGQQMSVLYGVQRCPAVRGGRSVRSLVWTAVQSGLTRYQKATLLAEAKVVHW